MPKNRNKVPEADKWDVAAFYPSWKEWEIELSQAAQDGKELSAYRGKLDQGADAVRGALEAELGGRRTLDRLVTYAHLRQDEDLGDDTHKGYFQRSVALLHSFEEQSAWLEPELLGIPVAVLSGYLQDPLLEEYRFHLERIIRRKPHTLSDREEELVAMAQKALSAPSQAFGMLENADFCFRRVRDAQGGEHELTLGNYQLHQRAADRSLRKDAFEALHGQFDSYANTLCELLNGQVQAHLFDARAHRFSSCVEAALFPHNIDVAVYRNLIQTVRQGVSGLHRYVSLRKQMLGVDALHAYDLSVPLVDAEDMGVPYETAAELVVQAVEPLGAAYQEALRRGLGQLRWVDRVENQGKRSGAYSSGCYDSAPYILLNYTGTPRDVLTVAHEAGHSMHSHLSHANQPYQYASYAIFVAEVASTFNEELLFRKLLDEASSEQQRLTLINQRIDDLRATLFRQTMFAEFELWIHEMAERGEPLTPSVLKAHYQQLNADYFGPDLVLDDPLAIEWARIPHFYYNFYVYQYATGISAALFLVDRVLAGDKTAKDRYLEFLSGGSSNYPVELLREAGVDMCSPEPVQSAIARFDQLVSVLDGNSKVEHLTCAVDRDVVKKS